MAEYDWIMEYEAEYPWIRRCSVISNGSTRVTQELSDVIQELSDVETIQKIIGKCLDRIDTLRKEEK